MLFNSIPLTDAILSAEVLAKDKKEAKKIGPCGVGEQALYIGSKYIERRFYIPWRRVVRVFKRVAMTPGGFSRRGIFSTMSYFVVKYDDGDERSCYVKRESDVDILLEVIQREHPRIPIYSAEAQKKLKAAEKKEAARYKDNLTQESEKSLKVLKEAISYLNENPSLHQVLVSSAKQKRIADGLKPAYRIGGIIASLVSLALVAFGLYTVLFSGQTYGLYFAAGGAAIFFTAVAANVAPNRWNNKKVANKQWEKAVEMLEKYISTFEGFPVPAHYAHPGVLSRMGRVIREGRTETTEEALTLAKQDLKAINSSVTVSQQEYDEIVLIKPLFLVRNYE